MILNDSHGRPVSVRLTAHGRERYRQRVNPNATDEEILTDCFNAHFRWRPDPLAHRRFVAAWAIDQWGHHQLVTVKTPDRSTRAGGPPPPCQLSG